MKLVKGMYMNQEKGSEVVENCLSVKVQAGNT